MRKINSTPCNIYISIFRRGDNMINITVKEENGHINIDVNGHANYAPHGQDIVCAGVSAILQTTILGLEAIADSYPHNVHIDHK